MSTTPFDFDGLLQSKGIDRASFDQLPTTEKVKGMKEIIPGFKDLPLSEQVKGLDDVLHPQGSTPPPSDPNSVLGGFGRRLWNAAKGTYEAVMAPPETTGEKIAANAGGPLGLPAYRMARGLGGAEGTAAGQVTEQAKSAVGAARQGQLLPAATQALRAGITGASMLDPFAVSSVTDINKLQDEGRQKEAVGTGLADISMLGGTEAVGKGLAPPEEAELAASSKTGLMRVLKPTPGKGGAAADAMERAVNTATDSGDLSKIFRETPLEGKGAAKIGDAIDKIDAYQDKLWQDGHETQIKRHAQMPLDTKAVINKALGAFDPDEAAAYRAADGKFQQGIQWAQDFSNRPMTLRAADKTIRVLNEQMKNPPPEWGNFDARVRMETLKALRGQIDKQLTDPSVGETGVADVNRRWGALQEVKERLGQRYWNEWQKQATKEANPVPSWMRAYVFAHPGGMSAVVGGRLVGSMLNPSDVSVFSDAAKSLGRMKAEPKAITTPAYVGKKPIALLSGPKMKALPPAPTSEGAVVTPEPPPQSSPKLPTSPAVEGQIHDQLAGGKMSVGEVFRMVRRGTLDQESANRILRRLRSNAKAPAPPRP